jgi:sialidase-1
MSLDEGKTWSHSAVVDPGSFAYSSIARLANDQVGVLFERKGYRSISFKAVSISELKPE